MYLYARLDNRKEEGASDEKSEWTERATRPSFVDPLTTELYIHAELYSITLIHLRIHPSQAHPHLISVIFVAHTGWQCVIQRPSMLYWVSSLGWLHNTVIAFPIKSHISDHSPIRLLPPTHGDKDMTVNETTERLEVRYVGQWVWEGFHMHRLLIGSTHSLSSLLCCSKASCLRDLSLCTLCVVRTSLTAFAISVCLRLSHSESREKK